MRKISKQIFKGHIADMSILMSFFSFSFKTTLLLCLFLLLFSLLSFDFAFLIFWYSIKYLGNIIGKFYYWPNRENRFYRGIIDCS